MVFRGCGFPHDEASWLKESLYFKGSKTFLLRKNVNLPLFYHWFYKSYTENSPPFCMAGVFIWKNWHYSNRSLFLMIVWKNLFFDCGIKCNTNIAKSQVNGGKMPIMVYYTPLKWHLLMRIATVKYCVYNWCDTISVILEVERKAWRKHNFSEQAMPSNSFSLTWTLVYSLALVYFFVRESFPPMSVRKTTLCWLFRVEDAE